MTRLQNGCSFYSTAFGVDFSFFFTYVACCLPHRRSFLNMSMLLVNDVISNWMLRLQVVLHHSACRLIRTRPLTPVSLSVKHQHPPLTPAVSHQRRRRGKHLSPLWGRKKGSHQRGTRDPDHHLRARGRDPDPEARWRRGDHVRGRERDEDLLHPVESSCTLIWRKRYRSCFSYYSTCCLCRSAGRRSRRSRSRSASLGRRRTIYSQRDRWRREPSHSPVLILRKNRSPARKQPDSPHRISELGQILWDILVLL